MQLNDLLSNLSNKDWMKYLIRKSEVYLVGGSVRDIFLNKPSKDIDIVVDGLSVKKILDILQFFGKASVEGESFAVIKFKPQNQKEIIDIAVPRIDKKIGKGHKGFEVVTDGVNIEDDLKRRDFTINSIAVNIETGEILDPFNGIGDIKDKLISATNVDTFRDDPLRILRGIQFAARFGFEIDPETLYMMKQDAHLIKEISGERILDELMKIIHKEGDTQIAINLIHRTNVDQALFNKKMLKYDKGFENLDEISFFYMLGLIGDQDPANFYKNRLKGKVPIENALRVLDNLFTMWLKLSSEEDKRYLVFQSIKRSPLILNVTIFPKDFDDIILDMRTNKIPMKSSDIQINGDDIINIGNIKESQIVGHILEKIYRDALMNRFKWKLRGHSIEYLKKLLS